MVNSKVGSQRTRALLVVLAPAVVLSVVGSRLTDGGHLAMYLLQFVFLVGGFWVADRAVRFSMPLWWTAVGLIALNLFMGGVNVHGDEIYNLEPGPHITRLDHPMHFVAAAVVTWGAWEALCRVVAESDWYRVMVAVVAGLVALGLGAIKETSDSITGWDTDPAEIVWSTRWDLVLNTLGAALAVAAIVLSGHLLRRAHTSTTSRLRT